MKSNTPRLVVASLIAIFLIAARSATAGPSTRDPDQPITLLIQDEDTTSLVAEGYRLLGEARKLTELLEKKLAAGQIKQIKLIDVGRAHVMNIQIGRAADRLFFRSEFNGSALRLAAAELNPRIDALIVALRPQFAEQLDKGYEVLKAKAEQRRTIIEQLAKAAKTKKLTSAAEAKFYSVYDELEAMACWYLPPSRIKPMKPFDSAAEELASEMKPPRQKEAQKIFSDAAAARQPDLAAFQTRLTTATAAIAKEGNANWSEKQLSGPELVSAVLLDQRKMDLAVAGSAVLSWASPEGAGRADATRLMESNNRFTADFPTALAAIVEADAGRVSETDARALYLEDLKAFAGWQMPGDSAPPPRVVGAALEKLAEKSPQLPSEIEMYRLATADYLRWRSRGAEARARGAQKAFGATVTDHSGRDAPKYFSSIGVIVESILADAREKRLKLKLAVARPWKMGGGGMANTTEFAYTCALPGIPWLPEVSRLKADLQSEVAPPLTLECAWAIASAQRGDWQEIGGEVVNVEVEGFFARQANCSEVNWASVDVNNFAKVSNDTAALAMLVRSELKPKWLRGNYVFMQLP
jgi:hypothetical protein